ncbi:MAG: hypothetical protein ACREDR_33135, partial [Blastocatellia bacterium]
ALVPVIVLLLAQVSPAQSPASGNSQSKQKLYEQKGSRERVYSVPFDRLWVACVRAANQKFVVRQSDKESGILNFETGTSITSEGFFVGVTLTRGDDDRVSVRLNPQKRKSTFSWGAGGRIEKKFFEAVDKQLADSEHNGSQQK